MSFSTRQPFGGTRGLDKPIRRFNLSLKKSRNLLKSDKENDSSIANENLVIRDVCETETFEADPSMSSSQNFCLRLSVSTDMESHSGRISRNKSRNTSPEASKNNEGSIVILSDSGSDQSPINTGRRNLYASSLMHRDFNKNDKSPSQTILLNSSDNEDVISPDPQRRRSLVSLSSDYDSSFGRLKNIGCKLQITDDISLTSDESVKHKIVTGSKSSSSDSTHVSTTPQRANVKKKHLSGNAASSIVNDFDKASIGGPVNRSKNSSSSSTHFSPSPEPQRFNKTGSSENSRYLSSTRKKGTADVTSLHLHCRDPSKIVDTNDFYGMVTPPLHRSTERVALWKSVQDSGIARENDFGNVTSRSIAEKCDKKTLVPDNCNDIIDETMSQQSGNSSLLQQSKNNGTSPIVGSYNYVSLSTPPVSRLIHKGSTRNHVQDSGISANVSLKTPGNSSSKAKAMNSAKLTSSVKKLTREEALKILNAIKSRSNREYRPKTDERAHSNRESGQSISQFSSSEDIQSSQSLPRSKVKKAQVIHETESDTDDEIVARSQVNPRPCKTYVSRFLEMSNQPQSQSLLSERKKKEISQWLMYSSPASQSDSSPGHVSDSNMNSPSSGNSSLERFEMEHETPNNRGKLLKPGTTEKISSAERPFTKQKTLDSYIHKPKPSILEIHKATPTEGTGSILNRQNGQTPNSNGTAAGRDRRIKNRANHMKPISSASAAKTPANNLDIMECADILDKLYGDAWKAKADIVLSASEPRKQNAVKNTQESCTERRVNPKAKRVTRVTLSASDSGDEFDKFINEIKPNFNSTKKLPSTSHNPKISFINDRSTSENSSESFYHTALTNPREFEDNRRPKNVPVSSQTERAIAIYDSESEDEGYNHNIRNKDLNRKRLSFSDDSDSGTSEFDPGELVVPKPNIKRGTVKTPRQPQKTVADSSVPKVRHSDWKRGKSFLASLSALVPMSCCHPEAKIYRTSYKNNRENLCKHLFKLYNEEIFDNKLPHDMMIEWNVRMRGTAGFCYNKKSTKALGNITRSSRIVLATKILDTPERLRDTLVHEMCHAAAWLINNISDGHGPFWKGWASKAMQKFPELPPIKRCHDYKIATKFTYRCTSCGYSIGRHSKSLDIQRKRCGHCYGQFELLINRTTKSGTVQVATPIHQRAPTGFALFVKENYQSVKKGRRSIKHGEVMRILGQQFSAVKIGQKNANADDQ